MASQHRRILTTLTATAALAALGLLTACSGGSAGTGDTGEFGFSAPEQKADSSITVWVDAAREPLAKAFVTANPDTPVKIETYDGNSGGSDSFKTKMALFDQSGSGWPDVVFSTQTNDASWASKETNGTQAFAAPLNKGLLDDSFLDGFTAGANDPMTLDDTVYGLRNDLAPVVLWYNQKLLTEFGYEAPTTWQDYEALSDKLAAEHPGYILGSVGDSFAGTYIYYWGAQAPIFQLDGDTFTSDFSDKHTTEMTKLLDHMVANGTLVQDSVFSADFVSKYADKLVGVPGPVWYTGAIFQGGLKTPAGQIGVAPALKWDGGEVAAGNVGGGEWYASSHSKNLDAVKTFLEFVTSADEFQVDASSGYPAYTTVASKWLDKQAEAKYFVNDDFTTVMTDAATQIWDGWNVTSWSPETAWAKIVIPGIAADKTVESLLPEWQKELENEATVNGYTVK